MIMMNAGCPRPPHAVNAALNASWGVRLTNVARAIPGYAAPRVSSAGQRTRLKCLWWGAEAIRAPGIVAAVVTRGYVHRRRAEAVSERVVAGGAARGGARERHVIGADPPAQRALRAALAVKAWEEE